MQLIKKIAFITAVVIFAIACGSKTTTVTQKKEQLDKLKKQQTDIAAQIKTLEADLAKLDTSNKKPEQAKLVQLDTVKSNAFSHYIELQGKIDADNISYVSPRGMGGQVRAVYVKEGDFVTKGKLLLRLDDAIVRQQVEAAKQGMGATKNQLELARNIYQRQQNLWNQKIGTEVQVLQAKTNVEVLENQLATQQANVRSAQEQLANANVYANVSGVAEEVNIHVGETFTGNPQMGIKIVNTSSLKVVTDIPENYLSRVSKGTPILITVPDLGKTYNSAISLISQSINPTSKGFTAEAKVPQDKVLKPNLTAMVKIQDYTAPNAITVPVNTLQTDEQGKFVLVAVKEGGRMVAKKRQVQIGELYGDKLEVKSGLQPGDVIVTEGFQNLYDGQVITTTATTI